MPPRVSIFAPRRLAFRTTPIVPRKRFAPTQRRLASDDATKTSTQSIPEETAGSNEVSIPHVTEEQAALDKAMGEEPPQIEEQGTPVQEVLQRDQEAQEKAPKVLKQEMSSQGQKRSFSTSARRPAAEAQMVTFQETLADGLEYPDAGFGHKFPLPDLANWKSTDHLRRRTDPVIDQVTKSLMRDGKLSIAQKNMDKILTTLRTAPTPQSQSTTAPSLLSDSSINTGKVLSPFLRRENLPLSPIQYLTSVIDSVAPLVKIRMQRGVLGGGQSLPIPVPMRIKQRRRTAIKWILDSAEKNKDDFLADRVAKEIIKVAGGTSGVWEKRTQVHRQATLARSNVRNMGAGQRRGGRR